MSVRCAEGAEQLEGAVGKREDALRLTEDIREAVEGAEEAAERAWRLLVAARLAGVHETLGYESFGTYVKTEFRVLRNTAWRRLTQALVSGEIAEAARLEGPVIISQRQAAKLRPKLAAVKDEIRDKTQGKPPARREAVVRHIVGRATSEPAPARPPKGYEVCSTCGGQGVVPVAATASS